MPWVEVVVEWSIIRNSKVDAGKYLLLIGLIVILDSPYFLKLSSSSLPHKMSYARV